MPVTLDWKTFELTHLRPVLNDVYKSQYNDSIIQATVYATIADLNGKGLTDIGPLPSSTIVGGEAQVNYITPGNSVATGNIFYISIYDAFVSYTAGSNATVASVVTGLTNAFNASTNPAFAGITAYDEAFRVVLEADEPGVPFLQESTATRGNTATNNPFLETIVNTQASEQEILINPITSVTAEAIDAFSLIASGVKYFIVSDPVRGLKTTAGLDIDKSEKLVQAAKAQYDLLTYAYIKVVKTKELTREEFWSSQFQVSSTQLTGGTGNGDLNLSDRLVILDREGQNKLAEINQKFRNDLRLQQQKREWQLEDGKYATSATNGVMTSAGLFTQTFIDDYNVPLVATVTSSVDNLDLTYFGLGSGTIGAEIITGIPIYVKDYNLLNLRINSSDTITFRIYELINGNYVQVGTDVTNTSDPNNNEIVKSYALGESTYIRIALQGYNPNTRIYIRGELKV